MKYIKLFILLISFALYSCGDCGLETAEYPCRVRGATITQFNSKLKVVDEEYFPEDSYNVANFLFPSDQSTSGILINDNRFDAEDYFSQFIILKSQNVTINGENLRVQLVNFFPTNDLMMGDLMVVSVDGSLSSATLRFAGSLSKFPDQFNSENSFQFCEEYLANYREDDEDYAEIGNAATQYGVSLDNAQAETYSKNNIVIFNAANEDVTTAYIDQLDQSTLDYLLQGENSESVDIRVQPGDVYYYRTNNGKEFAVLIADITSGSFTPFYKRVTIKFSELRGVKGSSCGN